MRFLSVCAALLVFPVGAVSAAAWSPSGPVDTVSDGTTFTVSSHTEVPGTTLKPGTYTIHVVDHLADRVILRIDDPKGKPLTTFLALPNPALRSAGSKGAIPWTNGPHKQTTLRGFSFDGGNTVEFVYPKADAVEIAKANSSKVVAIDPASEGHSANQKKLSQQDLQMLTLWSLAPTRVGPPNDSQAAIQAERYQAPVQEARNVVPAQPSAATQPSTQSAQPAYRTATTRQSAQSSAPRAAAQRKPVLAALPHTASELPLALVGGTLCLTMAGVLRLRRKHSDVA